MIHRPVAKREASIDDQRPVMKDEPGWSIIKGYDWTWQVQGSKGSS
jgi:hypothetical protein